MTRSRFMQWHITVGVPGIGRTACPATKDKRMKFCIPCLVFFGLSATAVHAEAPLAKLQVDPPQINLATAKDRQLLAVQAAYADGITRDVAAQASYVIANPALVRRD